MPPEGVATAQAAPAPAPKSPAAMDCKELDETMASGYRRVAELQASMPKTAPQGKTMADLQKMNAETKVQYIDPIIKEYVDAHKEYKARCKGEPAATKAVKKTSHTTYLR
jgi:hypothetical protein